MTQDPEQIFRHLIAQGAFPYDDILARTKQKISGQWQVVAGDIFTDRVREIVIINEVMDPERQVRQYQALLGRIGVTGEKKAVIFDASQLGEILSDEQGHILLDFAIKNRAYAHDCLTHLQSKQNSDGETKS